MAKGIRKDGGICALRVWASTGTLPCAADVAPAYTNRESGLETFSARIRRTERSWRIFGYDRMDSVVVVFDQVISTRESFRKRWQLHALDASRIIPAGFVLALPPDNRLGCGGEQLKTRVLPSKGALVNAIGDSKFQFFVDEKNCDENRALEARFQTLGSIHGEAGAWRGRGEPAARRAIRPLPRRAPARLLGGAPCPEGAPARGGPKGRLRDRRGKAYHPVVVRAWA